MTLPDYLRPSMLPKLVLCGQYRSEKNAGPAAERGTKLDGAFRDLLAGVPLAEGLDPVDMESVLWAVDTAKALSGGKALESREDALKVEACGLTGTADLLCEAGGWSADLKTGQKRNYWEQQAAYALGFMDQFFADEWTVYLLFCDLQEVETLRYTREEALVVVRGAIANALDDAPPVLNEYCGWCAQRFGCQARRESVALEVKEGAPVFESASSEQLREFVLRAGVVAEFSDKAREILTARAIAGEKIPGVSLVSKAGSSRLPSAELVPVASMIGVGPVLEALAKDISEAKAKGLFETAGVEFPAEKVITTPGSSYIRVSAPKAGKGKK